MAVSSLIRRVLPLVLGLMMVLPGSALAGVRAFVSILPQKYFVERIGGDLVDVEVLVMPGANPHMYEPSPRQMTALAGAQVYFAIGVNLEEVWLPRLADANRAMRIVRADQGVDKIPMAAHHHDEEGEEHDEHMHDGHEAEQDHDHGILDPHIWLDPVRAETIARNTCAGLVAVDPGHRAEYEANLAALLKDMETLNATISRTLAAVPEDRRSFLVFHPSWGYFADRYGLTQVAIEAGGSEPGPRHLAEIIEHGRELHVSAVFVQPQFSQRSAAVIASELKAAVVPLDPLAEDWKDNLLHAAEAFGKALR
jgi:zinc transport system substrate-binding protein